MRIAVFVKQVPAGMAVETDAVTGVLKRGGVKGKLNPFDLFAIEFAIGVRDMAGGSVTAVSMGPFAAGESLLEAVYMGADDACLVSDAAFAGSDVLATSKTLAGAVEALGGFDLIVCGKQTTDGDTAQIGPQVAEWLRRPHMTGVVSVVGVDLKSITVGVKTEELTQTVYMPLPCVVCVDKDINTPRLPSFLRKRGYSRDMIKTIGLGDLYDSDGENYGLNSSPTRVVRMFEPEAEIKSERIESDAVSAAARLLEVLREERIV